MRKLFALILVALLLGVGVVAVIETDPGYLLLAYGNYTLESSLWVGLLLLVLFVLLLYGLVALIRRLIGGPGSLAGWFGARRARVASRLTGRGLIGFIEGNWARARRQLVRGARNNEAPLLNYLLAARASHHLGEADKIQQYLGAAADSDASAAIAVELAEAELKLQAGEYQQALGVLSAARSDPGRHPRVLDLMSRAYRGLGDWASLASLLPDLKKHKIVGPDELQGLEREVYGTLLRQNAGSVTLDSLSSAWQKLPAEMKQDPAMLHYYVASLVDLKAWDLAEKAIVRELKHRWDPELVRLYGYINSDNLRRQMAQGEKWLEAHPEDPQLLLCMGRLCARDKLWGVARDYYERSYRLLRSPEICAELGRLLSGLGEANVAAAYFREGLMLCENRLPELPMPGKTVAQRHRQPQS